MSMRYKGKMYAKRPEIEESCTGCAFDIRKGRLGCVDVRLDGVNTPCGPGKFIYIRATKEGRGKYAAMKARKRLGL